MQKLLLELGGPLVFAFVLLGLARIIRGLIERYRKPGENEMEEGQGTDDDGTDHQSTGSQGTGHRSTD
jgi:hypothetical protein